jgi:hypothetical protein
MLGWYELSVRYCSGERGSLFNNLQIVKTRSSKIAICPVTVNRLNDVFFCKNQSKIAEIAKRERVIAKPGLFVPRIGRDMRARAVAISSTADSLSRLLTALLYSQSITKPRPPNVSGD